MLEIKKAMVREKVKTIIFPAMDEERKNVSATMVVVACNLGQLRDGLNKSKQLESILRDTEHNPLTIHAHAVLDQAEDLIGYFGLCDEARSLEATGKLIFNLISLATQLNWPIENVLDEIVTAKCADAKTFNVTDNVKNILRMHREQN